MKNSINLRKEPAVKIFLVMMILMQAHMIFPQPKYTNPHSSFSKMRRSGMATGNYSSVSGGNLFHKIPHHSSNYKNNLGAAQSEEYDMELTLLNESPNYKRQFKGNDLKK